MDNLLPRFPFDLNDKKDTKTKQWNYNKANNHNTNTINNNLRLLLSDDDNNDDSHDNNDNNIKKYTVFKTILGPNQRYDRTPVYNDNDNDPSPLSYNEAGINDIPKIILPLSLINIINDKEQKKYNKSSNYLNTFNVFISVENYYSLPLDIFIKIGSSIKYITLLSNRKCCKFIAGNNNTNAISSIDTCCYILTSLANSIIINMTGRQEIKTFHFKTGPIGMVVEIISERLTCVKIIEGSQASLYQSELDQSEIVSVNNNRVHTLEEFQNAVFIAQLHGSVTIQSKTYIGGRKKVDDLYAADFHRKRANVKTLFSNILNSGFDKEHQHGIELPSVDSSDEEEDDDDDDDDDDNNNDKNNVQTNEEDNENNNLQVVTTVDDDDNSLLVAKYERTNRESVVVDIDDTDMAVSVLHISNDIEEKPPVETPLPDTSKVDTDEEPKWDYATALEHAQILPYTRLICIPDVFQGSSSWDNPKKQFHVSNFSPVWDIHLYWIDEECALIPRATIKAGSRHVELISASHVWAVVASLNDNIKKKQGDTENESVIVDGINSSSVVLVIRPSISSIQQGKCTNVLWVPSRSITAMQTIHPAPKPQHKQNKDFFQIDESQLPNFHLQVIDSPKEYTTDGSMTSRSRISSKQPSRQQSRQKSRE